MALIYCDGFDHWGNVANMSNGGLWGIASSMTLNNGVGNARTGNYCLVLPASFVGSTRSRLSLPNNIASGGAGMAIKFDGGIGNTHGFGFWDNGTMQCAVYFNSNGGITLMRANGATLAQSVNGIVPAGSYFYLEAFVNIHPTAGYCEVRLNGNPTPIIIYNGPLQNGANNYYNQIWLGQHIDGQWGSGTVYYDDLVVWDTTGATNNAFFGNRYCLTVFPAADTAPNNWVTTNANRFSTMRNVPPNPAQYISGVNVNDQQSVTFDQLTNTAIAAVGGVSVYKNINTSDPGSGSSKVSITNAKGTINGQTAFPSTTPIWFVETFQTNADGSQLTRADINGIVGTVTRVS